MHTMTFNIPAYIESLKASGVDENQAKAQAAALDVALHEAAMALHDAVATKANIADVRADIAVVRAELKLLISETRVEILKWMCGMLFAQATLIVTLVKFL